MSFHLTTGFPKMLGVAVLVGMVTLGAVFIDRISDPLVNYHGTVMRHSSMIAQAHGVTPLFCQQLASFSFDANYTCFDSKQELDAFAATRRP